MRNLVDRAGSQVVATVVGWTFLAVAASLALTAVLGALAGPSAPVPVWRQVVAIAALGVAMVTGLGLLQGWRGAGITAVVLMLVAGLASGFWVVWALINAHPSKTDGEGYAALGAMIWTPALLVGAGLLVRERRRPATRERGDHAG